MYVCRLCGKFAGRFDQRFVGWPQTGPGLVRCSTTSGPLNSSAPGFFNIFPEVSFQFCHVDTSRMKGLGMAILTYIHTYLRRLCINSQPHIYIEGSDLPPVSMKPVPFPLPGLTSVPGIPTSSTPPSTPSCSQTYNTSSSCRQRAGRCR